MGTAYFGVLQHNFEDFIIIQKGKGQNGVKVYIFGKLSALAFEKKSKITIIGATGAKLW